MKGKQVFSSTKWRLGENVVFRLIEFLTSTVSFDTSMDNDSTSFPLLTHLGLELTTLEQLVCSAEIGYTNALSLRTNSCKKSNVAALNIPAQIKFCLVNQRDLFGLGTKLKESVFKNNNQINSIVATRTWVLSIKWIITWLSRR